MGNDTTTNGQPAIRFCKATSGNPLNFPSSLFQHLIIVFICPQASGTAEVSFASTLLEGKRLNAEEEFDLKWSAASLYSGKPYPIQNINIWYG